MRILNDYFANSEISVKFKEKAEALKAATTIFWFSIDFEKERFIYVLMMYLKCS